MRDGLDSGTEGVHGCDTGFAGFVLFVMADRCARAVKGNELVALPAKTGLQVTLMMRDTALQPKISIRKADAVLVDSTTAFVLPLPLLVQARSTLPP